MKKKMLAISDDLELPFDSVGSAPGAIWQKYAFLGRTGSGKTYAAKKLAELMLEAGAQIVVIDTVGVWPFLRLGPKPFSLPVLGGLYGDVPLEPTGGVVVADFVVDTGSSAVLDTSQMIDAEQVRFATAFGERFFQRKKAAPSPVHLFLEECQDIVPQNTEGFAGGIQRAVNVFNRIVKVGRNFQIGVSLISQRPQEVNKKALNQTECLFAFQMSGVQERKAIAAWMSDKGLDVDLVATLPKLAVGHAHVWSPQWLNVSKEIRISKICSLDAASMPQPKLGGWRAKLSQVDLPALQSRMAETIERAKADDPKELRKRIVELEKELRTKPVATKIEVQRVEVPVPVDWKRLHRRVIEELKEAIPGLVVAALVDEEAFHKQVTLKRPMPRVSDVPPVETYGVAKIQFSKPKATNGASNGAIGGGLRRMMIALAQRPGLTNRQLGVRAGLSSRSGTFSTYLSRGRSEGWIVDDGDRRTLTDAGLHALGRYEPLPEGGDLFRYWLNRLGGGASRMLAALSDNYPSALTNEQLGEAAEINHRSGTFSTYLSKLRTLELVEGRGELRLSEELVGG